MVFDLSTSVTQKEHRQVGHRGEVEGGVDVRHPLPWVGADRSEDSIDSLDDSSGSPKTPVTLSMAPMTPQTTPLAPAGVGTGGGRAPARRTPSTRRRCWIHSPDGLVGGGTAAEWSSDITDTKQAPQYAIDSTCICWVAKKQTKRKNGNSPRANARASRQAHQRKTTRKVRKVRVQGGWWLCERRRTCRPSGEGS